MYEQKSNMWIKLCFCVFAHQNSLENILKKTSAASIAQQFLKNGDIIQK